MTTTASRKRAEESMGVDGSALSRPLSTKPHKMARLAADPALIAARGVNLIEVDGKSCTHEVAWPPRDDPRDAAEPGPQTVAAAAAAAAGVAPTAAAAIAGVDEERSMVPPPPRPGAAAKEYPFKLDPFQQTAINCLETGHSVLVAAHTSAGKTVVAEYAFAMALRDGQRVIYTSPLKALSNQKYRELYEEFGDVGLMTGDVTINPTASCLVMTTEILRSMLYRNAEVVRETQLVVYDEIHYLRDKERGVVWEESIIMMSKAARFVFLSATIPNAREFAEWIATIHRSPCHVVYTDYRPTPLQHFMFPAGGDGLHMIVDERGVFREDSFHRAIAALTAKDGVQDGEGRGTKGKKKSGGKVISKDEDSDIFKVVKMLMEHQYDPVIVFNFSKKECEALALQMQSLDLNDDAERALVDGIFSNAVDCLSEDDRRLPQIQHLPGMLRRGVGVHHSGLLPIVKEVIEILFQEGLIKCLFATETFSTGLNMPAKTVVFTNARKFDGGGFRWISSGEYIQMSGRAGRRGLDDKGVVVLMLDTKLEPAVAKDMVKGAPDRLWSEFHLSYNMLLNLARAEHRRTEPDIVIRCSFLQFQTERSLPTLQLKAKLKPDAAADRELICREKEDERDAVDIEEEPRIAEYLALAQQAAGQRASLRAATFAPKHALPFLQAGRLVQLLAPKADAGATYHNGGSAAGSGGITEDVKESTVWGAILNFERVGAKCKDTGKQKSAAYIVDVLVNCAEGSSPVHGSRQQPRLVPPAPEGGVPLVVAFSLEQVAALSAVRMHVAKDLRSQEARRAAMHALAEIVANRFAGAPPLLDPQEDMGIADSGFRKLQRRLEATEGLLDDHPLAKSPTLRSRLAALQQKQALEAEVKQLRREAKAAQSLVLKDELKSRRRVLRRLSYITDEGVVTDKGRAAAEIQSADELVVTELMFNGVFSALNPEQIVALTSCFVWTEKSDVGVKVREDMEAPFLALLETARRVGRVAEECKLAVDVEEFVGSFRPDLMDVMAAWYRGAKFADVMKMTDVFEGSLVRAVRREEEVLRQMATAAAAIGAQELVEKFEACIERIKRDIVFAASLYL